jgi:formate/nitrite transporter
MMSETPEAQLQAKSSTVSFDPLTDVSESDVENPPLPAKEPTSSFEQPPGPSLVPSPPLMVQFKGTKAPKETLEAVYRAGEYKAALPLNLLMIQSFMAGVYIAMAGHLYLAVGGGILGSALFPTGLIAVVLTSAELFTGDALVFVASVLGGRVPFSKLCRNWTVAWCMNFAGCLFWAGLLAYASDSIEDLGVKDLTVKVALKKANQPWINILIKGIGANFMVCVGVWQATCAEEVAGKVLSIWFPIAAFVMMGFDHVIANQFLIPIGMMYGADISISHLLFKALLPATIGNALGGGLLVGAVYWYVYDSMASTKHVFERIRRGLSTKWYASSDNEDNNNEEKDQ